VLLCLIISYHLFFRIVSSHIIMSCPSRQLASMAEWQCVSILAYCIMSARQRVSSSELLLHGPALVVLLVGHVLDPLEHEVARLGGAHRAVLHQPRRLQQRLRGGPVLGLLAHALAKEGLELRREQARGLGRQVRDVAVDDGLSDAMR
jgi:hypothetical protein